jgi:UDP-N-acetyl-D-mannosaminuronic acid dehydrogenase
MSLISDVEERRAHVQVVGLGYVGVAAVAELLEEGFIVEGWDRDTIRRVALGQPETWPLPDDAGELAELWAEALASGRLRLVNGDLAAASDASVYVLCTETPARDGRFDPAPLEAALEHVARATRGRSDTVVVVHSTLPPGGTARYVRSALANVRVVYMPVRVMPGRLLHNSRNMPKLVGVDDVAGETLVRAMYRSATTRLRVVDVTTAELTKVAENALRDAEIALANELALLCGSYDRDFWQIRDLVNDVAGRNLRLAGPGVGGACLSKDTHLLLRGASGSSETAATTTSSEGDPTPEENLFAKARATNRAMPARVARRFFDALHQQGLPRQGGRVVALGLTYREDSFVTRDSPAREVIEHLRTLGLVVVEHDPHVAPGPIPHAEAAIVLVRHRAYANLAPADLGSSCRLVYDACGALGPAEGPTYTSFRRAGLHVAGLGRPHHRGSERP